MGASPVRTCDSAAVNHVCIRSTALEELHIYVFVMHKNRMGASPVRACDSAAVNHVRTRRSYLCFCRLCTQAAFYRVEYIKQLDICH